MDRQGFQSGLFGSYPYNDSSVNLPVSPGVGSISPYLNVDPKYLNQGDSQFIIPSGQARVRGRFELAFSQIGGSCMLGALFGGLNGLRISRNETQELKGRVRFSQGLTLVTKQGATSANALGVLALMYHILGLGLSQARQQEDELNTIGAATLTGILYKSTAGRVQMLRGGVAGLVLSSVWCLYQNKDKIKGFFGQSQLY